MVPTTTTTTAATEVGAGTEYFVGRMEEEAPWVRNTVNHLHLSQGIL